MLGSPHSASARAVTAAAMPGMAGLSELQRGQRWAYRTEEAQHQLDVLQKAGQPGLCMRSFAFRVSFSSTRVVEQ